MEEHTTLRQRRTATADKSIEIDLTESKVEIESNRNRIKLIDRTLIYRIELNCNQIEHIDHRMLQHGNPNQEAHSTPTDPKALQT